MEEGFNPNCLECSKREGKNIAFRKFTFDTLECPKCGTLLILEITKVRESETVSNLEKSLKAQEKVWLNTQAEEGRAKNALEREKREYDELKKRLGIEEKEFKQSKKDIEKELEDFDKEENPDKIIEELAWKGELNSHDVKRAKRELKTQKLEVTRTNTEYKNAKKKRKEAEKLYKNIKKDLKAAEKEAEIDIVDYDEPYF